MYIKSILLKKEDLIFIDIDSTIEESLSKIKDNHFLSLPVLDNGQFIGVISLYYIYDIYFTKTDKDKELFLKDFVYNHVNTDIDKLYEMDDIENVSFLYSVKNIPFVSIFNNNDEFVGIVTQKIIYKTLNDLFGTQRGVKIKVLTYDVQGRLKLLMSIIDKKGGNILNVVLDKPRTKLSLREIIIRIEADNIDKVIRAIKKEGFKVLEEI